MRAKTREDVEVVRPSMADEIVSKLEINETDIIGAVKSQIRLMTRLSVLLAESQRRMAVCTEATKTVRSKLMLKAYKHPSLLGDGVNLIAANVEAWYRVQDEYIDAVREAQEAEYNASVMQGLMYTLAHRRSAIEILSKCRSIDDGMNRMEHEVASVLGEEGMSISHPISRSVFKERERRNQKLAALKDKAREQMKRKKIGRGEST